MKKNFHNECNKENFDRCVACDKTHVTWNKSCELRQKKIRRIKITQNNTSIIYEKTKTETQMNQKMNDMKIIDVNWSKIIERNRKKSLSTFLLYQSI